MRFRHFILWILLALLPLRGWATSEMQMSMAANELAASAVAASSLQVEAQTPHHAAMPCHGEAVQAAHDGSDPSAHDSELDSTLEYSHGGHAACALCDLCHSVAMVTTAAHVNSMQTAATESLSLVSTDTGRALIGRLDRPPRRALAA